MHDLHGGIAGVDPLAAGAGSAADTDVQIFRFDFDIDFFGFRKHRHRGGAGMDALLGLSGRHSLDAMDSALKFEALINVYAGNGENNLSEPAQVGRTGIKGLDFPSSDFGVAGVDAVESGGEKGGFRTAGAS